MVDKVCDVCGAEYKVRPSKKNTSHYCSPKCFHKARVGCVVSEKTRRKLSVAMKGKTPQNIELLRSQEIRKKASDARRGKKLSEETRSKISKARMGIVFSPSHIENLRKSHLGFIPSETTRKRLSIAHSGSKTNFWKGGITELHGLIRSSEKYVIWRKSIMEGEGYRCQLCGRIGGRLEVHHKRLFSSIYREFLSINKALSPTNDKYTLLEKAKEFSPFWDKENGITLCVECHDSNELHKYKKELEHDGCRVLRLSC